MACANLVPNAIGPVPFISFLYLLSPSPPYLLDSPDAGWGEGRRSGGYLVPLRGIGIFGKRSHACTQMEGVAMDDERINRMRHELWAGRRRQAQSHAFTMSQNRPDWAVTLMMEAMGKFCTQVCPANAEEEILRSHQMFALNALIRSISHADTMSRTHPRVLDDMIKETKKLCQHDLLTREGIAAIHKDRSHSVQQSAIFVAATRNHE